MESNADIKAIMNTATMVAKTYQAMLDTGINERAAAKLTLGFWATMLGKAQPVVADIPDGMADLFRKTLVPQ